MVLDVHSAGVLYTGSFDYDNAFGYYGTRGGLLPAERGDRGDLIIQYLRALYNLLYKLCGIISQANKGQRIITSLDHLALPLDGSTASQPL